MALSKPIEFKKVAAGRCESTVVKPLSTKGLLWYYTCMLYYIINCIGQRKDTVLQNQSRAVSYVAIAIAISSGVGTFKSLYYYQIDQHQVARSCMDILPAKDLASLFFVIAAKTKKKHQLRGNG